MALAGLKKQFNKANQYMSEKIGGAEGTKYTDEFTTLERRTDLTNELVDELLNRTKEYLQPNPASRTKLMVSSKLKGAPGKPHSYPQPEGLLGEIMCKYGKDIGEESNFARSLIEMGEAMRELAEVKYALEDNVKQNFLEPLTHMQAKDLKDVMFHRKKLEGRRLDYDCKKRKKQNSARINDEEIRMAEDKFEESFNLASMGMHNLLQNEIEQLSQICVLSEALYEYHSQCSNILESLNSRLLEIKNEAAQRTFQPYVPKKLHELNLNVPGFGHDDLSPGEAHMNGSRFYSSSSTQSSFRSSNRSKYPGLARKPSSSSTSSPVASIKSGSSLHNGNGLSNGFANSTTAYLLGGKVNSGGAPVNPTSNSLSSHSQFSKSLLNVSSSNWDWDDDGPGQSYPSSNGTGQHPTSASYSTDYRASTYDLLSGLNFDPSNGTSNNYQNSNASSRSQYSRNSFNDHSSTTSPSVEHPPKPNNLFLDTSKVNNLRSPNASPLPSPVRSPARTPESRGPCAQALYDFDPENDNELNLKEGEIIQLVSQIDENWYEGSVNGRTGLFPVSYVQVLVPLQSNGR